MIESLLIKIAGAIFKKTALAGFAHAANAYEICSAFSAVSHFARCVGTVNDCHALGVRGLHLVSDTLAPQIVDHLINVGSTTFEVSKTIDGLYIASSLTGRFAVSGLQFPTIDARGFPGLNPRRFPSF